MPQNNPPPAARTGGQGSGEDSGFNFRKIINALLIAYCVNWGVQYFIGSNKTRQTGPKIPAFDQNPAAGGIVSDYNPIPQAIAPIWPEDSLIDVRVYVAPSLAIPPLRQMPSGSLILSEDNFHIGNYSDNREVSTTFPVPRDVQQNGTLWAHVFIARHGHEIDPKAPAYNVKDAYHVFRPLNHILAKKKVARTKKLLGGGDDQEEFVEDASKGPVLSSYYHPNFTLAVIPNTGVLTYPQVPPASRQWLQLETTGARDPTGQNGWYYPIVYLNTFWQLREYMTEINSTVKELPIRIDLNNLANWKFNLYANMDENVKNQQRQIANGGPAPAGGDGSEFEELKRILIDTNIYLLSTTAVVSVLHMIFEALAFKNDVAHWRNKKDNVGVSVRTILGNVFMQLVIFLYLVDNSDGTSWMILFGQGMGILLEAWKITKTVNVRVRPAAPGSLIPYQVTFEDKHQLSETEKKTEEYDKQAFKYLYMVGVPLLIIYAVYSVLYESHKGWYSFILTTLVGSVYAYGFLMMVPSLYINYRLKSVAHMPGRAMTYKVLNTFIDDLFAFTIKMPTLHRLATLRDDVIFFVYVYQSYKYKVDYSRVNEFGQGGDEEEDKKAEGKKVEDKNDGPSADVDASAITTGADKGTGQKRVTETKAS